MTWISKYIPNYNTVTSSEKKMKDLVSLCYVKVNSDFNKKKSSKISMIYLYVAYIGSLTFLDLVYVRIYGPAQDFLWMRDLWHVELFCTFWSGCLVDKFPVSIQIQCKSQD